MLSKKKNFLSLFPVPESLLFSNAGIAITDTNVKFVQFRHALIGESLKLTRFDTANLPDGVMQSGFINNPDKLGAILKDLALRHNLKYVYATLPEERTYLFSAVIEKVPVEALHDAVAFIIEENVPIALADSVFDFNVVEDIKATNQLKVTVSVLSKKVVDFYVQVFEAAGITPVSFDIESQAIARAIIPRGDRRTQLIINLGEKKTGFYVVEDEVVAFTTTLPYGVSNVRHDSHLSDLNMEMKKIFSFWNARPANSDNVERKIERILLCGPGAFETEFVNGFLGETTVRYDFANPWVNVSRDLEILSQQEISREAMGFVSAIGLVLPRALRHYV